MFESIRFALRLAVGCAAVGALATPELADGEIVKVTFSDKGTSAPMDMDQGLVMTPARHGRLQQRG